MFRYTAEVVGNKHNLTKGSIHRRLKFLCHIELHSTCCKGPSRLIQSSWAVMASSVCHWVCAWFGYFSVSYQCLRAWPSALICRHTPPIRITTDLKYAETARDKIFSGPGKEVLVTVYDLIEMDYFCNSATIMSWCSLPWIRLVVFKHHKTSIREARFEASRFAAFCIFAFLCGHLFSSSLVKLFVVCTQLAPRNQVIPWMA